MRIPHGLEIAFRQKIRDEYERYKIEKLDPKVAQEGNISEGGVASVMNGIKYNNLIASIDKLNDKIKSYNIDLPTEFLNREYASFVNIHLKDLKPNFENKKLNLKKTCWECHFDHKKSKEIYKSGTSVSIGKYELGLDTKLLDCQREIRLPDTSTGMKIVYDVQDCATFILARTCDELIDFYETKMGREFSTNDMALRAHKPC